MKKQFLISLLIVLLSFTVFTISYAKQPPATQKPATKLEQFLAKKGKILVKEFHKAGVFYGQYATKITIDALIIYEPGKGRDKIRGLRIEVYEGGRLDRSDTAFLDKEEVESLSQAITYMINLIKKWRGAYREYTEVIFSTKGDFKLGFYQQNTQLQGFAQSGVIGAAHCYFPIDKLSELKEIIDKGNASAQ